MQLHFEWEPSVESDIAGYRVFSRQDSQEYDYNEPLWDGEETFCSLLVAETETRYFVARAYDYDGFESDDSNEVVYPGDEAPGNDLYKEKNVYGSEGGSIEAGGCFIAAAS